MHFRQEMNLTVKRLPSFVAIIAVIVAATAAIAAVEPPYATFNGFDDVIVDQQTRLEWQRNPKGDATAYVIAVGSCKDFKPKTDAGADVGIMDSGGKSEWRLPTIKELLSIVDERGEDWQGQAIYANRNAFAPALATFTSKIFWSSSPANNSGEYMTVNFSSGSSTARSAAQGAAVICVRDLN
jgi:hypothetical protein